jgi:hypothetical protein
VKPSCLRKIPKGHTPKACFKAACSRPHLLSGSLANQVEPRYSSNIFYHPLVLVFKGTPMHVAPTCLGFKEGFNHFGFYVHSLSLHQQQKKSRLSKNFLLGNSKAPLNNIHCLSFSNWQLQLYDPSASSSSKLTHE